MSDKMFEKRRIDLRKKGIYRLKKFYDEQIIVLNLKRFYEK